MGVLFPWVKVRGTATYLSDEGYAITVLPSSVEGYETADGICALILGVVASVVLSAAIAALVREPARKSKPVR